MTTGEKIKKIRLEKKLSQRELGDRLGITQQMIGQYENSSKMPKLETIQKIAKALEVNTSDLLDIEEELKEVAQDAEETRNSILGDLPKNKQEVAEWKENLLLEQFRKLNRTGKNKAIEDTEDLTYIKKYTESDED